MGRQRNRRFRLGKPCEFHGSIKIINKSKKTRMCLFRKPFAQMRQGDIKPQKMQEEEEVTSPMPKEENKISKPRNYGINLPGEGPSAGNQVDDEVMKVKESPVQSVLLVNQASINENQMQGEKFESAGTSKVSGVVDSAGTSKVSGIVESAGTSKVSGIVDSAGTSKVLGFDLNMLPDDSE